MGGREVPRPYRFGFSPKARGFLSFWRCHSTNDRCEALASLKGCFFMFLFQSPSIPPSSIPQRWGNLQVQMFGETEQSAIWRTLGGC